MEDINKYTATLTMSSEGVDDAVTFEFKFSHDRNTLDQQPVAFQIMDYVAQAAVLPMVAISEDIDRGDISIADSPTSIN